MDAAANAPKQLRSALCRSFVNFVGLPGPALDRCSRPEANPSRRRVGRLAKATSWSLHSDRRCRVGLTLQMTVGEEFARLECGNGGAAASIVPPTIPSRLGRAADRPRRRPMPFQGVSPSGRITSIGEGPLCASGPWPGGPHPVTGPGAGGDPAATGISRRGFSRTRAPTARSVVWRRPET